LANPYPFQHLLGRAQWDAEAVRDAHCQEVLAGLGQEDAALAIDETGCIKKGDKSAGVARQYCGASGKIDNCQVGVFLSWQTAKGHALIDRVLYLPQEWTDDPARCRAAGIPEEVTFATKPELARRLVERALDAGARPAWVVADAVYGADSKLRFFLEERDQPYVVAVASNQSVWVGLTQYRVKALAAQVPAKAWRRLTVGAGAKGPRRFEWAAVPINHPYEPRRWQRWVLMRRSCEDPEDLAFYLAFGPAGTSLEALARVAGGPALSPLRRLLPKAKAKSAWISMKCAPGSGGIGT
jgi:SRSO17 transposase